MKLAMGGVVAILSMCSDARAETSRPFLCWGFVEVTGSSALYDRPGGVEIGKLDPAQRTAWGKRPMKLMVRCGAKSGERRSRWDGLEEQT